MNLSALARKALEVYLQEKRVITQNELPLDDKTSFLCDTKDAVFVTLYLAGNVVASSGRIHPQKKNTILEAIDNTLQCLSDPRLGNKLTSPEDLSKISIRVDHLLQNERKVIQKISDLDITSQGLIFLSQKFEAASVVLPNISSIPTSSDDIFFLAVKKAGLDPAGLQETDYLLYAFSSHQYTDF